MSQSFLAASVEQADAEHSYRIFVDGRRAGLTAFHDHGDQRVFYHTEIDDAYADQGLAAVLVGRALADVRASGKRFVAICPYVALFVKRHPEFAEFADPATPEILRWLQTQAS